MRIDEVQYVEFNTYSTSFTDWVEALRNRRNEFVVVVDDNSDSHALLKISAAINRVSTQHIHFDTAKLVSTGGRGMTRENIVHQLNIKSFGLNHKALFDHDIVNLNLDNENVFVIGLDVCHPTGNNFRGATVVPSTVGIVGNYLENPNSFAGTFFYQKPRQEFVDPCFLYVSVKKMLQRNPRAAKINTIVILRDGVSEGQYAKILDTEVAAIKKCSTEIFGHPNTRIVCIIVTKNGNARHFDMTYKHPQSLPPRSVVTFGCRFQFNQFYIVPHRAFQGTAKAIMVTVIQDDVGCEAIEIQKFILALTNLHQIVCSPISLPEPVYLSDSLAQRGYEVFSTYSKVCSNQIRRDEKGHMKLQELSYDLGFNFENSQ
jgi:eukaryotic translation initiation factor 2C